MSKVRVCFMGTPDFAVTALQGLLADDHFEVVGVVTQPDRPAGRKLQLTPSAVKKLATENGIVVISPESLRKDREALEIIKSWKAEVAVVVAYGQILSQEVLDIFPLACVNIHGSLLPKWRGAAPIQRSVEAGDTETGVALQKMVFKLDAGDVLGIRKVQVTEEMNAKELHDLLAKAGAELLRTELVDFIQGNLVPMPQDESLVTYAKKIDKAEAEISWEKSAQEIHRKVNAFVMGPGCWTLLDGKKIKVHRTRVFDAAKSDSSKIGKMISHPEKLLIQAKPGILELIEVQPESRTRMSAAEFLKGLHS